MPELTEAEAKKRMMALRDTLLKKMRAIEDQIAGLDIAIRIVAESDDSLRSRRETPSD